MANTFFRFKQFTIHQERCAMKVTTDACLFGSWISKNISVQLPQKVLDIGTGTGLLSLMLAQRRPYLIIDAVELDKEAAEQAKKNVAESPWAEKINVMQADTRNLLPTKKYDIIISNPPFYEAELKSANESKNIAHHSEELRFTELLQIIRRHLKPGSSFFLLLPFKRFEEFREKLSESELILIRATLVKQSTKHNYFRVMTEGKYQSNPGTEVLFEDLSICNEYQQYSNKFIELLNDFYLKL